LHTSQLLIILHCNILKINIQLINVPQNLGIFTAHFVPPLINIGPPPIDYMTLIIELSLFTEHVRLPPIALNLFTEHLRLPAIALSLFTEHLRLPPIALSLFTEHPGLFTEGIGLTSRGFVPFSKA
jgi:hypothetical protein